MRVLLQLLERERKKKDGSVVRTITYDDFENKNVLVVTHCVESAGLCRMYRPKNLSVEQSGLAGVRKQQCG